ncbi:MAG: DUF4406 domain-containing protein [Prevotella sp.]
MKENFNSRIRAFKKFDEETLKYYDPEMFSAIRISQDRHLYMVLFKNGHCITMYDKNIERMLSETDDPKQMPIYLSGPIESIGYHQARENFHKAKIILRNAGYKRILNPIQFFKKETADQMEWSRIMIHDLRALTMCTQIAMLPLWEQSCGARIEHDFAIHEGKRVLLFNSDFTLEDPMQ